MTFSDKIKVSRELCNLTQQQLADKVGVSKRTIAAYETTDAKARSSTMRKLAVALNVQSRESKRRAISNWQEANMEQRLRMKWTNC